MSLSGKGGPEEGAACRFAFRTHLPPTAGQQQLLSPVSQAETLTGCNCGNGDSSSCIVCLLLLNLFMTIEAGGMASSPICRWGAEVPSLHAVVEQGVGGSQAQ